MIAADVNSKVQSLEDQVGIARRDETSPVPADRQVVRAFELNDGPRGEFFLIPVTDLPVATQALRRI